MLGNIGIRERNRSTSRGRRSYSAQTRAIAPASHSRGIEARYSTGWNLERLLKDVEYEKNPTELGKTNRSISQQPRHKTLQIVELGSTPHKYSVVRHVEEPQTEFVREGT